MDLPNDLQALTAGLASLKAKSTPTTMTLADPGGAARIDMVGVVGWEIDADEVKGILAGITDASRIDLHLDSPGGSYWAGVAIANALRQHPTPVHVHVDAMAASAASVIAMAGDSITMYPGSMLMIHNARQTLLSATAAAMRDSAKVLEDANLDMAGIYQAKAGGTVDGWLEVMAEEVWYRGEDALSAGLVDRVVKPGGDTDEPEAVAGEVAGWTIAALAALGHRPPTAEELDLPGWVADADTEDLTGEDDDAEDDDEGADPDPLKLDDPDELADDDDDETDVVSILRGALISPPANQVIDLAAFAAAVRTTQKGH